MASSGDVLGGGNNSDLEIGSHVHTQQQQQQAAAVQAQLAAEEEAQRISLLDVIIEEYNQEKNARTSRMILIGELDSEKIPLIQKFHADFLDSLDMKDPTARMTGVLFVLNANVMIQVVEAPTKTLVQLMRNLAEVSGMGAGASGPGAAGKMNLTSAAMAGAPLGKPLDSPSAASSFISVDARFHPLLKSSSILSFTEEVPREFHIWAFRGIKLPSDDFVASQGIHLQKDALKLVFETVKNMLELGREMSSSMSEERAIDYVQTSLARQLTIKLPTSERLVAYIHGLNGDLCTMQEWLEIYDTPIQFTLENEKVWPVEPFLKY